LDLYGDILIDLLIMDVEYNSILNNYNVNYHLIMKYMIYKMRKLKLILTNGIDSQLHLMECNSIYNMILRRNYQIRN